MTERVTACDCPQPGWCERHRFAKTPHLWKLCRLRADYFAQWEAGHGVGQPVPQPRPVCRHRGAEALATVECDLCGMRGTQVAVYACAVLEKCTERRFTSYLHRSRGYAVCALCDSFAAAEEPRP